VKRLSVVGVVLMAAPIAVAWRFKTEELLAFRLPG
jgi:hypothetical protein